MVHAGKMTEHQKRGVQAPNRGAATAALVFACVFGSCAGMAHAQPAATAACIVTAQNRSVPLGGEASFVLPNLPGRGQVPFGAGVSGQPFRVRALCDDGSVGETPLAFPIVGYELVQPGELTWGASTQPPASLSLGLPATRIGFGGKMQAQVLASFPDGRSADLSARRTGTGYRSSHPGLVGVSDDGAVYFQTGSVLQMFLLTSALPARVLLSAENDGVVSSRVLKVSDGSALQVTLVAPNGVTPQGAAAKLALEGAGYVDQGQTVAVGGTALYADLPFLPTGTRWLLRGLEPQSRAYGSQTIDAFTGGGVFSANLALQAPGRVTVRLLDEQGQPLPGVSVGLEDAASGLAEIAPLQTAADGTVEFSRVAAGRVAPLIGLPNVRIAAGANELQPGGQLSFVATASTSAVLNQAQIRGRLQASAPGSTGLGMTVALHHGTSSQLLYRQVIDSSQQFQFSGLVPNAAYELRLSQAGDELMRARAATGAPNSSTQVDLWLPAIAALGGALLGDDGSPKLAACTVQVLGQTSGSFKRVSADAQGRFFVGRFVTPDLYRLEASCDDGSSAQELLDWTTGVPNGRLNRQLILSTGPATATVDISATVMGRFTSVPLGAQVMVENSNCPSACPQGVLANAGEHLRLEMPRGEHRFSVSWAGRTERFSVTIDSRNAGKTITQVVNFGPDVSRLLEFAGQQSLYEFAAIGGGRLDLAAAGLAMDGRPAALGLAFDVYDRAGKLLASSAGQGMSLAITLPGADRYLVLVRQTDPSEPAQLGGYGLLANLNGSLLPLRAWLPDSVGYGSGLRGHVRRPDWSPAAGQLLQVRAGQVNGPQLVEQLRADGAGAFHYNSLLTGDVELRALYKGATLARAQAPLAPETQFIELDLDLREKADLALTVRFSALALPLSRVRVEVVDGFGPRQEWLSVSAGDASVSASLGAVAGDVVVQAEHPGNPSYAVLRQVNVAPEATERVDLALLSGRLTGRVLDGFGAALVGARVSLKAEDGGSLHAPQTTDASGRFSMGVAPAQQTLTVVANDPLSEVEGARTLALQPEQDLDLVALGLPTGRLTGDVRFSDQQAAANYQLELTLPSGRQLYVSTDSKGQYEFARVPAGVNLPLRLVNNNATQSVSVAAGVVLNVPAFVIAKNTYTIRGRVMSHSGVPLAGVPVVLGNDGIVADCSASGASGTGPNTVLVRTDASGGFELQLARVAGSNYRASSAVRSGGACNQASTAYAVGVADTVIELGTLSLKAVGSFSIKVQDSEQRTLSTPYVKLTCDVGEPIPSVGVPEIRLVQPDGSVKVVSPQQLQLSNQPIGRYRAMLRLCETDFGLGELDLGVDDKSSLSIVVPTISGRLLNADGTRADVQRLFGRVGSLYYAVSEVDAELKLVPASGADAEALMYRVPVGLGDRYVLLAELPSNAFEWARFTGPLSVPHQSTGVDLQLQPRARVQGCVKLANGDVAGSHSVTLALQPNPDWQRKRDDWRQVASSSGCFQFDGVPNGVAELMAVSGSGSKLATELLVDAKQDAETLNEDLRYLQPGVLRLKALDASGAGISADYAVFQRKTIADNYIGQNGVTGSLGKAGAVIGGLIAGDYLISAWDDVKCVAAHMPLRVAGGQTVDLELSLLGDGSFRHGETCPKEDLSVPKGAVNFTFVSDGSFYESGVSPYSLLTVADWLVDGHFMPFSQVLTHRVGQRAYAFGPFLTPSGVDVVRRSYVPPSGGYARILDSYSNATDLPITFTVQHRTLGRFKFGYANAVSEIKPAFDPVRGFTSFVVRQVEDRSQIPIVSVAHVFGGTAAGTVAPDRVDAFSEHGPLTQWTLTLMPGERAALLHYYVLDEFFYKASAVRELAESLANQSKEGMFDGLSANDKALIRNFLIQP